MEDLAVVLKPFYDALAYSISGAWVDKASGSLAVRRSIRDSVLAKARTVVTTYAQGAAGKWAPVAPATLQDSAILGYSPSPSGKLAVAIRKDGAEPAKAKVWVEVYDVAAGALLRAHAVEAKVHGDVVMDAWFGGIEWSADERFISYIAEAKAADTAAVFDPLPAAAAAAPAGAASPAPLRGQQYDYDIPGSGAAPGTAREVWGERYEGVRCPRVFVADLFGSRGIVPVAGIPDDVSAGQCVWAPGTSTSPYILTYTGWSTRPRRLGMIYCYNRPCKLYAVDVSAALVGEEGAPKEGAAATGGSSSSSGGSEAPPTTPVHVCLTPDDTVARGARFSPPATEGGPVLTFFCNSGSALSTHNGASQLKIVRGWATWAAGAFASRQAAAAAAAPAAAVLVDTRATPLPQEAGGFPGLYVHVPPSRCWAPDGSRIFFTSVKRSRHVVYAVDVRECCPSGDGGTGRVQEVNAFASGEEARAAFYGSGYETGVTGSGPAAASSHVLGVYAGPGGDGLRLVTVASTPNTPERVAVVDLAESSGCCSALTVTAVSLPPALPVPSALPAPAGSIASSPVAPRTLTPPLAPALTDVLAKLTSIHWRVLSIPTLSSLQGDAAAAAAEPAADAIEGILLHPSPTSSGGGPVPLIIAPHGGPHSTFGTDFMLSLAIYVAHGYAVLMVNYRGSLGFGEAATTALPGKCGTMDVNDTYAAALTALVASGVAPQALGLPAEAAAVVAATTGAPVSTPLDVSRVGILGGSHGGFLVCHSLGQFPGFFKAGVARNPVTNIAIMTGITDIPDWCYVEACGIGSYDYSSFRPPTAAQLGAMLAASPISHVHRVTAPVLLMLGMKDRRVPSAQGIEYYHVLRQAGASAAAKEHTRLICYPEDVHALDRPATEVDAVANILTFLGKHLK